MIDLHCHTRISDNSMTAEEVILLAKQRHITHLAITDHDTTEGLDAAVELGRLHGVSIIPGIEISACDFERRRKVHILGLYIKPGYGALERLCRPISDRRNGVSHEMVKKIAAAGYDISWERVREYAQGSAGVYKQHIMHALMDAGYCDGIYSPLYKALFSRPGGLAFIELEYADMKAAVAAVAEAGGIPVLAHPGQLDSYDAIPGLCECGLGGIEVYHPSHNGEAIKKSLAYAGEYGLAVTGGSDFHGLYDELPDNKPGVGELGEECILELEKRHHSIHHPRHPTSG